jgi:hypothetical protein
MASRKGKQESHKNLECHSASGTHYCISIFPTDVRTMEIWCVDPHHLTLSLPRPSRIRTGAYPFGGRISKSGPKVNFVRIILFFPRFLRQPKRLVRKGGYFWSFLGRNFPKILSELVIQPIKGYSPVLQNSAGFCWPSVNFAIQLGRMADFCQQH